MPDDPSPPAPTSLRKPTALLLVVGVFLLTGALRIWWIDLDPPGLVVVGYKGQAHYRDEAAKAHEARNKAKWDRWSLSEVNEYEFWRVQSPSWVWGEYLWFEVFGVSLVAARSFVIVQTLVALALLLWLAMIRHGPPAAIAAGLLLGLNWPYLIYSRLALMEGALICWLLVATVALAQIDRRRDQLGRWTALAVAAMLVACTIKQTGLLLVPAFAVALVILGLRAAKRPEDGAGRPRIAALRERLVRRESVIAIVGVALLGVILALLVFNPEYQQRLAFNAEHFTAARKQPVLTRATQTLIEGLFGARLRLMYLRLAPLIMILATVEIGRILVVALLGLRRRKRGRELPDTPLTRAPDAIDWWMLAWALLAMAANLASPHRAIRFQLIILPPAAWLAGVLVMRLWTQTHARAWLARAVRIAVLVVGVLASTFCVAKFVDWCRIESSSAVELGPELEALIGDRHAVVVGEFAAQAVFDTDYWHFYVRPTQFNERGEIIDALGITHMVVRVGDDFVERHLQKHRPKLLEGRRELGRLAYREYFLIVYELRSAAADEDQIGKP